MKKGVVGVRKVTVISALIGEKEIVKIPVGGLKQFARNVPIFQ